MSGGWWHAYGATMPVDDPQYAEAWVMVVIGPVHVGPDEQRPSGKAAVRDDFRFPDGTELPYLTSWDHEPSDEEKAALEPAEEGAVE